MKEENTNRIGDKINSLAKDVAVAGNDIARIKTDIGEIKEGIKDISKQFPTRAEFLEVIKVINETTADHERRMRIIEENMWKWVGMSIVFSSVMAIGISVLVKMLIK